MSARGPAGEERWARLHAELRENQRRSAAEPQPPVAWITLFLCLFPFVASFLAYVYYRLVW